MHPDLSFVVDCSSTIAYQGIDNWRFIIEFMVKVVSAINVGERATHVGAVTFGTLLQRCSFFVTIYHSTHWNFRQTVVLRYSSVVVNRQAIVGG